VAACNCLLLHAPGKVLQTNEQLQQVILQFPEAVPQPPLQPVLLLEFSYNLQEGLDGFYRSSFIGEAILTRIGLLVNSSNVCVVQYLLLLQTLFCFFNGRMCSSLPVNFIAASWLHAVAVDHTISDADQVHCADVTVAAVGGGGMLLLVLL